METVITCQKCGQELLEIIGDIQGIRNLIDPDPDIMFEVSYLPANGQIKTSCCVACIRSEELEEKEAMIENYREELEMPQIFDHAKRVLETAVKILKRDNLIDFSRNGRLDFAILAARLLKDIHLMRYRNDQTEYGFYTDITDQDMDMEPIFEFLDKYEREI